jgi:hypothetical protein
MSPARKPEDNSIDVVGSGDELDTLLLSDMRRMEGGFVRN